VADTYFVGLRATADLVDNEDPQSWRAGILRLFPNGSAPLTALTALMKSEKVSHDRFHWWTKTLTSQRASTALYTTAGLGTLYTSGSASAGDMVHAKVSLVDSNMFRAGHQVLLRDASDYNVDTTGKVSNVIKNGASSVISIILLEDDDNSTTSTDLSDADVVLIVGNINAQGAARPEAITQGPTEFENYTQIWRNSTDISRTLMETRLRTSPNIEKEIKKDTLELHSIEIEKALLWSTLFSTGTGANGKPERATRGVLSFIKEFGTVQDYTLDMAAAYAGKTWLQMGDEWLDEHLEEIFRFGSDERLAFVGSGALLGIQRLVKDRGMMSLTPQQTIWGSNVVVWTTPFGAITMKTHPLFSYEATNRHSMVLLEPKNLRWMYVSDTSFYPDNSFKKGGGVGIDGKQEEFLTEAGLEIHFPETGGYLNSIGLDNTQ